MGVARVYMSRVEATIEYGILDRVTNTEILLLVCVCQSNSYNAFSQNYRKI